MLRLIKILPAMLLVSLIMKPTSSFALDNTTSIVLIKAFKDKCQSGTLDLASIEAKADRTLMPSTHNDTKPDGDKPILKTWINGAPGENYILSLEAKPNPQGKTIVCSLGGWVSDPDASRLDLMHGLNISTTPIISNEPKDVKKYSWQLDQGRELSIKIVHNLVLTSLSQLEK